MRIIASFLFLVFALTTLGCGVRTQLEIRDDGSIHTDGSHPFDAGPDMGWDGGGCTSDFQCDDRLTCDGTESCIAGHCQRGMAVDCNDGVDCTADVCVEGGGCVSRPNDALCPSGFVCSPGVGCIPGTHRCMTNADCDDHLACNGVESCDPTSGQCFAGPPMFCGDGVTCTDDVCVEGVGCVHSANSAECPLNQICDPMIGCLSRMCGPTGGCDDGDPCNGSEFCSADGVCHPGSPLFCNDGNPCTVDFCRTGIGCSTSLMPEICGDGQDNDCNMLIDCMDPVCIGSPVCGCVPRAPFEQFCSDRNDDDCNGLTDCADPACNFNPACGPMDSGLMCVPIAPVEVICTDGRDDDCDRFVDCGDPDCFGRPECGGFDVGPVRDGGPICSFPEQCHNGVDDDCNGFTDCNDGFCIMTDPSCRTCVPTSMFERRCGDGLDDDCDGLFDCADPDCRASRFCRDAGGLPDSGFRDSGPEAGFVDMGTPVTNEIGVAMCTNGIDDDRDGRTDCADPDCRPFGPMGECCNGIDDTNDGNVDEFTCRCFDNSFCPNVGSLDQVCWLNSYSVCAPRCNFYGGNTFCQMNLPTTPTCNSTTGECE